MNAKDADRDIKILVKENDSRMRATRAERADMDNKTVEYRRFLKRWVYLSALGFLVIVDWIANAPVFRELLPQDAGAMRIWENAVADSERYSAAVGGLVRLWIKLALNPEASILALGVIAFLMLLAHFCGASLRRTMALRFQEETAGRGTLRPHIQQAAIPMVLSCIGLLVVLASLYWSRAKLDQVTRARSSDASAIVETLKQKVYREANDPVALITDRRKLTDAESDAESRRSSADYAEGIKGMNQPILFLNLALVLTAVAASYLESQDKVYLLKRSTDEAEQSASFQTTITRKRNELQELTSRLREHRARIRQLNRSFVLI